MANINVVFPHGQVLWLLQVFINPGLSPYHFSIHLDQFSHPEDGGSMFLWNIIRKISTWYRGTKDDHQL